MLPWRPPDWHKQHLSSMSLQSLRSTQAQRCYAIPVTPPQMWSRQWLQPCRRASSLLVAVGHLPYSAGQHRWSVPRGGNAQPSHAQSRMHGCAHTLPALRRLSPSLLLCCSVCLRRLWPPCVCVSELSGVKPKIPSWRSSLWPCIMSATVSCTYSGLLAAPAAALLFCLPCPLSPCLRPLWPYCVRMNQNPWGLNPR